MERICGECKKCYGEKCFCCGDDQPHVIGTEPERFKCRKCGHKWTRGEDPVTTGICDRCITGALAKLSIATA